MSSRIKIKFEPRDIWIGLYRDTDAGKLYICFLPCLPIIITPRAPLKLSRLISVLAPGFCSVAILIIGVLIGKANDWSVGSYWTLGLGVALVAALGYALPDLLKAPRRSRGHGGSEDAR